MLIELFTPYYHVIAVSNGKDGLDAVKEHMPDIVLSDVLLEEGMTGIELCREIKRNIETCHIPVVLLTACTAIEYKLEGIQTGADDYITKPFDINVLLARCKNLVNNRIVLQEKFSKQPQNNFQMIATNPLDMKFVEQAMQVIEKHIGDSDFSMNDFAREMCIARTKLFIKLKAITGQTPNDLILTVRLHKAAVLLKIIRNIILPIYLLFWDLVLHVTLAAALKINMELHLKYIEERMFHQIGNRWKPDLSLVKQNQLKWKIFHNKETAT